ncbi:MAG: hypothetical protein ACI30I_05725 [Parabacteroides sp.]
MEQLDWQLICVILIGIACVAYVVYRLVQGFRHPSGSGKCKGCPNCGPHCLQ